MPAEPLHIACLCAAWCRLCDGYAQVFEDVVAQLRSTHPALRVHWVDIEDEADWLGDLDVETFPTLVLADARGAYFAGPVTPQRDTLLRLLQHTLQQARSGAAPAALPPAAVAFAQRLVQRG